jgi:hypothetical protein
MSLRRIGEGDVLLCMLMPPMGDVKLEKIRYNNCNG